MKIMLVLAGFVLMIAYFVISTSDMAQAEEVLGTGTGELLGGDLTDPEDDGDPEAELLADEKNALLHIKAVDSTVEIAHALGQGFLKMIRHPDSGALLPWLEDVAESSIPALMNFAKGIKADLSAGPSSRSGTSSQTGCLRASPTRITSSPSTMAPSRTWTRASRRSSRTWKRDESSIARSSYSTQTTARRSTSTSAGSTTTACTIRTCTCRK